MFLFCLLTLLTVEPAFEIKLDLGKTEGMEIGFHKMTLCADGSLLGISSHQIMHWDENGTLLRQLGRRGEGPGEFMFIGEALWDGSHYWLIDSSRQLSSIFNAEGELLFQQPLYYRQVLRVEDKLFTLDHSDLSYDPVTYPPVVQPISYEIKDSQLVVSKTGPAFRKITKRQMDFMFNFKLVWVALDGDRYLVVDQLEPKICIYNAEVINLENSVPATQTFVPKTIPIQVRDWVESPKSLPSGSKSQAEMRRWWFSFSRINYFSKLSSENEYIVSYFVPDPNEKNTFIQVIQVIDKGGRIIAPVIESNGMIVGTQDRKILVYEPEETELDTLHKLHLYQF